MRYFIGIICGVTLLAIVPSQFHSAFASKNDAALNKFRCMIAGSWDNENQAASDIAEGLDPFDQHERRSMTYVPIANDNIEGQLFGILNYSKTGFNDPATRLSTHRFRWSKTDEAIVHEFFFLKDKGDWGTSIQNDLERLTHIREVDVTINTQCAMRWQWRGDHFVGATEVGKCITSSFTEKPILIEGHGELFAEKLLRHDQNFDLEGNRLPVKGSNNAEVFDKVIRQSYPAGLKEKIEAVSVPLNCANR